MDCNYSTKITALKNASIPLVSDEVRVIESFKTDIEKAILAPIDYQVHFQIETDASDDSIAATLSHVGRPVAFFSRSLNSSKKRMHIMEEEAYAIVECVRK